MWVCRLPVHIGPLGSYEFAEDYRKIGAICRVDVGIDPYNHACRHICIRRKISEKALLPAGQQSLSSPDCLQELSAPTEIAFPPVKTGSTYFDNKIGEHIWISHSE